MSLNELQLGEYGVVKAIHATDKVRRRFLDLGIVPNTKVKCLYRSPFKDPTAYFIRGTTIALRNEDASLIEITRMEESSWA